MAADATEPLPQAYNTTADLWFGVVLVVCVVWGVPANIISITYFRTQHNQNRTKKQFFNDLYLLIAFNDLLVNLTTFPVIGSLLMSRDPGLFSSLIVCSVWGAIWEIIPYVAVFLVAVLSITRMVIVVRPIQTLNRVALRLVTLGFVLMLAVLKSIPIIWKYTWGLDDAGAGVGTFKYNKHSVYCFYNTRTRDGAPTEYTHLWKMYSIVCTLFLAFPIIPIMVSCGVSIGKIVQAGRGTRRLRANTKVQQSATVTVVIVTGVYITYNIPVFMNYVLWSVASFSPDLRYRELYHTSFLYWYSWVLTYVILVVLNSATNPLVYYFRMHGFKKYVWRGIHHVTEDLGVSGGGGGGGCGGTGAGGDSAGGIGMTALRFSSRKPPHPPSLNKGGGGRDMVIMNKEIIGREEKE